MSGEKKGNPEALLQKYRKLEENKVCPNCGEESKLGFTNVCVPYKSFICNNCKAAHQAFSHRVKSVTMSTWTLKEVKALNPKNGGGNENCKKIWLANGDVEKYRPHPGDDLDKFKRFIEMAYVMKKFYAGEDGAEEEEEEPEEEEEAPKKKVVKKVVKKAVKHEEEEEEEEEAPKKKVVKKVVKKAAKNDEEEEAPKKKTTKKVVKKSKEEVKSDNLLGFEVDSAETRIQKLLASTDFNAPAQPTAAPMGGLPSNEAYQKIAEANAISSLSSIPSNPMMGYGMYPQQQQMMGMGYGMYPQQQMMGMGYGMYQQQQQRGF